MTDELSQFDGHLAAWRDYQEAPWGRLRYAVVAHTLGRILPRCDPGLRLLDVGGGDGRDALVLARAGHDVTVLDSAPGMLAIARDAAAAEGLEQAITTVHGSLDDLLNWPRGGFDAVLCHFLLQYRQDTQRDLHLLARVLRPGGLLSLIAPNPAGLVLAAAARGGPRAAEKELHQDQTYTTTFDQAVLKIDYRDVRRLLEQEGLMVEGQYGGRCVNDLITNDGAKWHPEYYADLERLEIALSDREPYTLTAQFWHLVASAPA